MQQQNSEISLIELLAGIISFFKRKFVLMATITTVGIIMGFLFHFFVPKHYDSRMIVSVNFMEEELVGELCENVTALRKSDKTDDLIKLLNTTEKVAKNILSIKVINKKSGKKEQKKGEAVNVNLFVSMLSPEMNEEVEKGILYFLGNNAVAKQKLQVEEVMLKEHIKILDKEIAELELQKKEYNKFLSQGKTNSVVVESGFGSISNKIISYSKEKTTLEAELKNKKIAELASPLRFTDIKLPSKFKIVLIPTFIFAFLSLIVALVQEINNYKK